MVAHLLVLSMLFNNVRYLECYLRPTIEKLVSPGFWRYEHYMLIHSPYPPMADYFLGTQALIALLVALCFRRKIWSGSDRGPDARTAIGIDAKRKLLFLAVAEWASPHLVLEQLTKLGARDAMLLDGGGSSAMAIGEGGRDLARGALFGGWRPVATFFGIRARRLNSP